MEGEGRTIVIGKRQRYDENRQTGVTHNRSTQLYFATPFNGPFVIETDHNHWKHDREK
jgi:hypothetical protein